MYDKKSVVLFLIFFIIVFIVIVLFVINLIEPRFYVKFTGKAVNIQKIDVRQKELEMQSPENRTYNIRDKSNYFIDLNVSANFDVRTWKYDLIDVTHNVVASKGVTFTPPVKIKVNRWENKLIVQTVDEFGDYFNKSIEFFVSSLDSFPVIENLDENIYVCEGDSLYYVFNVTDPEENRNEGPIEVRIDPFELFYVVPDSQKMLPGQKNTEFEIFSRKINKEDIGGVDNGFKIHQRTINVNDGKYSSLDTTNIILLEINNPPEIQDMGVKTKVVGKNNIFVYKINVSDIEDGDAESGNLKFSTDFSGERLFEISNNGLINFEFYKEDIGVHDITICVSDNGIENSDPKINEFCKQNGGSQISCKNFSLTIAEQNNAPTITSYSPILSNLNKGGNSKIHFNITFYDPEGTIPDVYWYVDDSLEKYYSGIDLNGSFSEFEYGGDCKNLGEHSVRVRITDGILNDTIFWKINTNSFDCSEESIYCEEKWACDSWGVCQNLNISLKSGIIEYSDYLSIQDDCTANKWNGINCGFQIRTCIDNNICNASFKIPEEFRRCFYTESPDCEDGIKNCHSRDCEILVDCGGPCKLCPTCYDDAQNQGEEGVDCGGPCYTGCNIKDLPVSSSKSLLKPFFIVVIFFLIGIITLKIHNISKIRREIKMGENLVTFSNQE